MKEASFGNDIALLSLLGYIVSLTDKTNRANVLSQSSYKSKRIVRSVLGAETYSFPNYFDAASTLRNKLNGTLEK